MLVLKKDPSKSSLGSGLDSGASVFVPKTIRDIVMEPFSKHEKRLSLKSLILILPSCLKVDKRFARTKSSAKF